ncbi:MAG TPA: GH116 family glycosyl hydrolase [Planctomycetota bacterium]|nr:GH116 family glycosyl hydrolase [Planctomycetota bacterium]
MKQPAHLQCSRKDLFRPGAPRVYRGRELDNIAFPLGGIGTGSISLGGWGQLRDFEIFNRPAKGLGFDCSFFTLYAKRAGEPAVTRVVQGPVGGADFGGDGSGRLHRGSGGGLPHFRSVEFEGAFPFARLTFADPAMPLKVCLEAYNPFIPHNPDDSSLPAAVFNFTLKNAGKKPVDVVLAASLENRCGHPEVGDGIIKPFDSGAARGLAMSTARHRPDSARFGTLALATNHRNVLVQTHWFRGSWFDALQRFWDEISTGALEEVSEPAVREKGCDIGTLALRARIAPGRSVRLPVIIAWHTPNAEKYWGNSHGSERRADGPVWRNHYAQLHADAPAVAEYAAANAARLERETRQFAEALFASTLPAAVLDAVSSQISILKTTTCLRLPDGSFYGWEGCHPDGGCCEGTCTHVWNYAQALAALFPSLERSIRETDYAFNLQDDGKMTFRMPLPPGTKADGKFHAAGDGQMGGIMKVYREWQNGAGDEWLRRLWPSVKKALEYAWKEWDRDKDGVMECGQHNTYDVEFHGPNTMMGGFYLGALRAAEEMARHLGEEGRAEEYRAVYESGRRKMDAELWNGEFYIQDVRPPAAAETAPTCAPGSGCCCSPKTIDPQDPAFPKYQYGAGCLSDQLIGQWFAHLLDLGDLFDPEHVRTAMAAVFRHNWKSDLSTHANPQRIYAVNDEAALLACTWPRGGRPRFPFPYSDEVFCGIEYQAASHMIMEGLVAEGLAVVKGVRDRHTGVRRNPWNEYECGNHYARSLASWALLPALSGFRYSAPARKVTIAPRVAQKDFVCFFATGTAWGLVRQKLGKGKKRAAVEVIAGELLVRELALAFAGKAARVILGKKSVKSTVQTTADGCVVRLDKPALVRRGQALAVEV